MRKKLLLVLVFALVASLLLVPAAFAQDGDTAAEEEEELVRVEVRNRTDQPVTIVLTSGILPEQGGEGDAGGAVTTSAAAINTANRQNVEVGTESGRIRFFGLAVGPGDSRTFTVERGVYYHRTTACGQTVDGVIDASSQLRLIFTPCDQEVANPGEPSMEKISFFDDTPSGTKWSYAFEQTAE